MSESALRIYQERRELNSEGMKAIRDDESDQKDPAQIKQDAEAYYTQLDGLDKEDPNYQKNYSALGEVPTDNDGWPVDRTGARIPDMYEGQSDADMIRSMQSEAVDDSERMEKQRAIELSKKQERKRARDQIMAEYRVGQEPLISADEMAKKPWLARMGLQAVGGVADAVMEVGRTGSLMLYKMTEQSRDLTIEEQERFDYLNSVDSTLYGGPFTALKIESDGSLDGSLVRTFSQFMVPFLAALRGVKVIGAAAGVATTTATKIAGGTVAGMVTDYSTFSAADGNMSDLLLELGVEGDLLEYMSASRASDQLEGKLKLAIDGAVAGAAFEIAIGVGKAGLKWTNDKKTISKTADFIFKMVQAIRNLNKAKIKELENQSLEVITNYQLTELDKVPIEQKLLPAPEKEKKPIPVDAQQDLPIVESKEKVAPQPYVAPAIEVQEAYSQYAMTKIMSEGMSLNDWKGFMAGRAHPQLIDEAYKNAEEYINKGGDKGAVYYSMTERAIIGLAQEKPMKGTGWLQRIKGMQNPGKGSKDIPDPQMKVVAAEAKWLGLEGWLKEQGGRKVSKNEIIKYMRDNRVELEEFDRGKGEGVHIDENGLSIQRVGRISDYIDEEIPDVYAGEPTIDTDQYDDFVSTEKDYYLNEHKDEWAQEFRNEIEDEYIDPDTGEIDEGALQSDIDESINNRAQAWAENSAEGSAPKSLEFEAFGADYKITSSRDYGQWDVYIYGNHDETADSLGQARDRVLEAMKENGWDYASELSDEDIGLTTEVGPVDNPVLEHEAYTMDGDYTNYNEFVITMPELDVGVVQSSHFKEENVIPHIRTTDRANADNVISLHIEEIQSDYAKKAKDEGYVSEKEDEATIKKWVKEKEDLIQEYRTKNNKWLRIKAHMNRLFDESTKAETGSAREKFLQKKYADLERVATAEADNLQRIKKEKRALEAKILSPGVPDQPWKTPEERLGLSMRRMVRYAVDSGKTRVTWSTGNQVTEQWKSFLGTEADTIHYDRNRKILFVKYQGEEKIVASGVNSASVSDYISGDAAKRLLDNSIARKDGIGSVKAEDVIASKGYRDVYDKQAVAAAKKFLKQFKGAKVTRSEIDFGSKGIQEVWAIEITPEMKASVKQGVNLMQFAPILPAVPAAGQLIETEDNGT